MNTRQLSDATPADIRALDPIGDLNLTVDDWMEYDEKGFNAAFKEAVHDDAEELLMEMFCDRCRHDHKADVRTLEKRMNEKLEREVTNCESWIDRWRERFIDGD